MSKQHLIQRFRALGAVQYGDFVLASGQRSSVYFDVRLALLDGWALDQIATVWTDRIGDGVSVHAVGGTGLGGTVLVGAIISYLTYLRAFVLRDAPKSHGTGQLVEGCLDPGVRVVVVEDVVTTGGSVRRVLDVVRQAGATPVQVLAVLDRGSEDRTEIDGVPFRCLLTAGDFAEGEKV